MKYKSLIIFLVSFRLIFSNELFALKDYLCLIMSNQYTTKNEKGYLTQIADMAKSNGDLTLSANKVIARMFQNCIARIENLSEKEVVYKVKDLISRDPVINPAEYLENPKNILNISQKENQLTKQEKDILRLIANLQAIPKVW